MGNFYIIAILFFTFGLFIINELFYLLLDHLFLPACDINLFQGYQISFIINYYHFHLSSFLPGIPVVTPNYAVTAAIWQHLPASTMLWRHLPAIPMLWQHLPAITMLWQHLPAIPMLWRHLPAIPMLWRHLPASTML